MKILHLNVSRAPFEVMVTGEKLHEYRKPSKWFLSRLLNKDGTPKHYDWIKFVQGYGKNRPYFVADFLHWKVNQAYHKVEYSNGLIVEVEKGDVIIKLGQIIERMF